MSLDIWLKQSFAACDHCGSVAREIEPWSGNYTHNVSPMWDKAGIRGALYDSDGVAAGTLVDALDAGIDAMCASPDEYRKLNPSNGWGDYDTALAFAIEFRDACKANPLAIVHVWK